MAKSIWTPGCELVGQNVSKSNGLFVSFTATTTTTSLLNRLLTRLDVNLCEAKPELLFQFLSKLERFFLSLWACFVHTLGHDLGTTFVTLLKQRTTLCTLVSPLI